jgi:hypothetical protein
MKNTILLFLFGLFLLPSAPVRAESCGAANPTSLEEILQLKKAKDAFDDAEMHGMDLSKFQAAACRGPGYACRNSGECCGSSFCRSGSCSDSGNSCRGPGASCRNSGECCGSSFCRDGYCGDNGNSCRGEGAKCRNSGECCGSTFCRSGFCS